MPYCNRPMHAGDVVFFLPPEGDQPVVHRVVRVTPAGISTRGDNNALDDAFLLQPENVQGKVVAAWRGQRRRRITGGLRGRLINRWFRWQSRLDHGAAPFLHPIYHALSFRGWCAWLLPAALRPRVVVFRRQGRISYNLCWDSASSGDTITTGSNGRSNGPFTCLWMEGRFQPSRIATR